MADALVTESLTKDEILAVGWGGGIAIADIASYLGLTVPQVALRRYELGVPDRDHRGVITNTRTHPFDFDGRDVAKIELNPPPK
jgi:hypothetical protein